MSAPLPSAAVPRSSNLAVPATQNTAPVTKFRCLFTHDMRRKAKRWQDGFLRYHTFNKRVMVYDNTGYFIGDLHWRRPEEIQDGDELELDKGVLIQVCEPVERSETDISSLYKNKSQISPSRPGEAPPSSARSTAPRSLLPSQQASRSLNDLLGVRKTTPTQLLSPYEQRHGQRQATAQQPHEPPAKRQRTASLERGSRPIGYRQDVVNLSDSPPREQGAIIAPRSCPAVKTRDNPDRSAASPNRLPPEVPADTHPSKHLETSRSHPTALPVAQNPIPPNPTFDAPTNTLRLSSDKPRRKLMYQESWNEASAKAPTQLRTQLSRTYSQCQPTTHEARVSSPEMIILDEDDVVEQPQPKTYEVKPSDLSRGNSSNGGATTFISKPAEQPQPPQKSSNSTSSILPPKSQRPQPSHSHFTEVNVNTAKPRPTDLRKSFSDPTTINGLYAGPLPVTSPLNASTDKSDEQGPWTSEALDLFDFWPPGRPKPT